MSPRHEQDRERLELRDVELSWRAVEGEIVALDLRKSEYLAINRSGAPLWEALAEGTDRETLVELLVERFGRERDAAEDDVEAFLSAVKRQGLLR